MCKLSNYISSVNDLDIATLLGITGFEYMLLVHSPLYYYKNAEGVIVEFFIYINPVTNKKILKRIKNIQNNIVRFAPSEILRQLRK